MLTRVALFAVLALLSVCGTVAQTATYTFCYQLRGLAHETLDDPYSIAVLVTGLYNTSLQTSTYKGKVPAGSYYNLLTGTGTRTIHTRNNKNVTYTITMLDPVGSDFSDNRLYISNASFPQFVDGNGLTFNLSTLGQFPGKQYSYFWNVYRTGTFGPVLEDKTSGEDLVHGFNFSANIAGWTGKQYVAGTCNPLGLESAASPAIKPSAQVYTITLFYNISSSAIERPSWNVVVNAVFKTDGTVYGPDAFGDYWFQPNTASGVTTGTRKYTFGSTTTTSTITGVSPIGLYGFADNRIYTYSPYFDYEGISYTISPAQAKPGAPQGVNTTVAINPYVSKGGLFFEGFGDGGTLKNGSANTALTKFTVSIVAK